MRGEVDAGGSKVGCLRGVWGSGTASNEGERSTDFSSATAMAVSASAAVASSFETAPSGCGVTVASTSTFVSSS